MVASSKSIVRANEIPKDKKVRISCPICNTQKVLKLPLECVNRSSHLTSVLVPSEKICVHSFIAYLDHEFKCRGTQKIDFIV